MKTTSERRELILFHLHQKGSVQVADLAEMFSVSTVTIRNDLGALEKKGIVTRAYGGAYLNKANISLTEYSIDQKSKFNDVIKQRIGKLAATLINEGDSIILDSGTTTSQIAEHLQNIKNVIVMTNGINVANALIKSPGIEILITGGHLRRKSLSFFGSQAEQSLKQYHFNKLFLGVDGFHLEKGISTHNEPEAQLNRAMCEVADEIIVVTDSSKFSNISLHKILDSKRVDTVITDDGISENDLASLKQLGIKVLLVEK
ncbi:DNA-binding transcriptional regulator AgaR [Psychromonas sp. CNPT3]|uniref:transcriptional repressor AgaR n=1 Tax=Psychromonas sp. CNPT3 TaxID=314282 RepID=UPI00006E589C|nr:transcriptional repressor AgaR [Psychromonas sp. CNPT3]AGH82319.1 DNA-binding transcriptional regulator AgaR [Psychromonas sp. CNPT3]